MTLTSPPAAPTKALALPTDAPSEPALAAPEPDEAILIIEPGPGSRVESPVRVAGIADPTFEQTLMVRIILPDGRLLAEQVMEIAANMGARGPFEIELPFSIDEKQNALIQVYAQSARDGGITHLASTGVTLLEQGPAEILLAQPHPEQIMIRRPALGDTINGGNVQVEGFGLASFEGTLIVEIYDANGILVGSQPLIADAPDLGLPGSFDVLVAYVVETAGPGRVVVIDPLPVFDGLGHIASVEVMLEP
jgi:hypothetical protein